ncbi:MAG: MarR family winged helix-turn-helix transcriptional regulator [Acidimicrobiales bacterium]
MCAAPSNPPRAHPSTVDGEGGLLRAEKDIQNRLAGQQLDFPSMLAVSNIYRAASAVRRQAERDLLTPAGLSWGGFTILWVLWIWGEMETARLASECDLAKGTLTGMLNTLEKQKLVARNRMDSDRRRVMVTLTETGEETIGELFPRFNAYEGAATIGLTDGEKADLAKLLRVVITNTAPEE